MEQLDFFEIVKLIFAALAALSALISFFQNDLRLSWNRFFRGLFVLSAAVLIIFPLNVCVDSTTLNAFGKYIVNIFMTGITVAAFMIAIFAIVLVFVCFCFLLKALWEWIKVSD
ncbi:MAG: hypothetical protein J6A33_03840 [Alphaproteobacteria bacterium]|nr:hypothetical protein [Alphaproteobacteria bacterium]